MSHYAQLETARGDVQDHRQQQHKHQRSMWRSLACLSVILVIAIAGISVDTLATQHGESDDIDASSGTEYVKADVDYAWRQFKMTVKYPNEHRRKKTVSYNNATDMTCDVCSNEASDENYSEDCYCKKMRKCRDAGRTYIGFYIAGIVFIFLAALFATFVSLGRCLCHCKWPCHWLVAAQVFMAWISFVVACVVLYAHFIPNLSDVISYLIAVYFPVVNTLLDDDDDWDNAIAGGSLICLLVVTIMTCSALPLVFSDGRRTRGGFQPHHSV